MGRAIPGRLAITLALAAAVFLAGVGASQAASIAGTYSAVGTGLALAGGARTAQLKNSKGVLLTLKGKQIGLEFSLDLSGLQVSLK